MDDLARTSHHPSTATALCRMLILISITFYPVQQFASEAGIAKYIRGIATVKNEAGKISVLGNGGTIQQGDEIYTGNNSFAIIQLRDETKMTLRPNTTFKINKYVYEPEKPAKNSGFFSLIRGGLRAITGFLNKTKTNAMVLKAPTATIGIRGTEFDVRICDNDCAVESKAKPGRKSKKPTTRKAVGRIAFMRGTIMAENNLLGKDRKLSTGGPVYENDLLKTGLSSFAVIAFRDKSRVTLRAQSELLIEKFNFKPNEPKANASIFQMLKGGLRMITGLIGKLNRERTRVHTPTATIGIRGTGFDLLCTGNCGEPSEKPVKLIPLNRQLNSQKKPVKTEALNNGMFVHVWDGVITLQQQTQITEIKSGWSTFLRDSTSKLRVIHGVPRSMQNFDAPRPDSVDIDHEQLFGTEESSSKEPGPGLYVSVYDGHVAVENAQGQVTDIGAGEALVALTSGQIVRLPEIPAFQANDQIPSPKNYDQGLLEMQEVLNQDATGGDQESLECSVR